MLAILVWNFPDDLPDTPTLHHCLKMHYDSVASNTLPARSLNLTLRENPVEDHRALICRTYCKLLEVLNYISKLGKPTLFGKCAIAITETYFEPCVILLELLRSGFIHKGEFSQYAWWDLLNEEEQTA
jgi:hypothetical protein